MRIAGAGLLALGMALLLIAGCGITGQNISDTGGAVTSIGTVAGGFNPLVGLIMGVVGAGLTAAGEAKKRSEGR